MILCPLRRRDVRTGAHGFGFCVGSAREARVTPADLLRAFSRHAPAFPLFETGCSRSVIRRTD